MLLMIISILELCEVDIPTCAWIVFLILGIIATADMVKKAVDKYDNM